MAPYPRIRASTCAPRSAAADSASSTRTPAPSPITKPSRRASNGREIPVGEVAAIAPKAAVESGLIALSAPPTTHTSAAPWATIR